MFWHLDHMTHMPISVGMVGLVRVIPLLTLGLFGGVVADQRDRRSVLLVTQSGMASAALGMTVMTWSNHVTPWLIYAMVAWEACFRAYNGPVRQAMIANLVPPEHFPNAASINGIQWRLAEVLGPAFAGLLIAGLGPHQGLATCYLLNCLSFGAFIAAVFTIPKMPPKVARSKNTREVLASIRQGVDFLRQTPVIANAMWIDFWGTFLAGASALLATYVRAVLHLDSRWYGYLAASGGIGAMAASGVMALRPTIRRQGAVVITMIAAFGGFTLAFALTRNFWTAALCYAGIGATDMVSTVLRQTIRQLTVPDDMRGRLSAIGQLFQISGPQLGDLEAASVAQAWNIQGSLAMGGVGAFFIASWYWFRRTPLARYIHREPHEAQELDPEPPGNEPETIITP